MVKYHATHLTFDPLAVIYVCLTMDTGVTRHTLAVVAVNHVQTATTIVTHWTVFGVWADTIAVTI